MAVKSMCDGIKYTYDGEKKYERRRRNDGKEDACNNKYIE